MRARNRQRGVAIVAIVILLVLFVAIGAFMATRSGVQHASIALSVRSMQAWFAAQSGLEWAVHQAVSSQASHDAICDAGGTIVTSFTLGGGASAGYDLRITCNDNGGYQEGGVNFEVDVIDVVASRGSPGEIAHAARRVEALVTTGEALP